VGRVEQFLHGLKIVLSHHSAPYQVIKSFEVQAREYLSVDNEEIFLKRAKYLILYPMAFYLQRQNKINDLPSVPDVGFSAKGRWRRWSRERLHSFRRKNTHLWYSFLQAKRAAEPVSLGIVLTNFLEHREKMSKPDLLEGDLHGQELIDDMLQGISPILSKIRDAVNTELKDFAANPGLVLSHKASESASIEMPRSGGGQAGFLRDLIQTSVVRGEGDLVRMDWHPRIVEKDHKILPNQTSEVRTKWGERELLEDVVNREISSFSEPRRLEAKVEAVIEPFKVRTISKGESLPYYIAKPVQKVIHTCMRSMPVFRLIGTPFDPTMLMDLVQNFRKFCPTMLSRTGEQYEWMSIDYRDATDGVSAIGSKKTLGELIGDLMFQNFNLFNLLVSVLAPHHVSYPRISITEAQALELMEKIAIQRMNGVDPHINLIVEEYKGLFKFYIDIDPVDQLNGQLMGSILSFPILCLLNFALTVYVIKSEFPQLTMEQISGIVLINGDDNVYIGNDRMWRLHVLLGEKIGLRMSVGKAYKHPCYVNINSASVHYDLRLKNSTPRLVPFMNTGLLLGNHKVLDRVGGDDCVDEQRPIISVTNLVVSGALPGKQKDLLAHFLKINRNEISREAQGRNMFLPVGLGGFGVVRPLGFRTRITPEQYTLASRLMKRNIFLSPITPPMNSGYEIEEIQDQIIDPIRNHPNSKEVSIPKLRNLIGPQWNSHLFVPWRGYVFTEPSLEEKELENEPYSFDLTGNPYDIDSDEFIEELPGNLSDLDSSTDDSQDWGDLLGSEYDDSSVDDEFDYSDSTISEELEMDPYSFDDDLFE
jgi:hypothetical protein